MASRLTGFALMWAALLGFAIVELRPLTHVLWTRWHAVYVGEQWEYSSEPIPRVLHQTWKTHEPPPELLGYIESWHVHNPHLEYMLWNDTEGLSLIETHYPWFYKHMDAFKTGVERADIMRYFILYHYGGIYADLDMEAVRPIEPLLAMHDDSFGVALGTEPFDHAQNQGSRNILVCNAMMVSQPKHPFWEAVFRALLEQVPRIKAAEAGGEHQSPVDTTGPVLLTKIFEKHPDAFMDVMVYPSNVFYPFKDDESKYKPIDPNRDKFAGTYAAHRWHHLWFGRHHHKKKKPWERKISQEMRDWQPQGSDRWDRPPHGMHGHHGMMGMGSMPGGWGGGWNDRPGPPPDNGAWNGHDFQNDGGAAVWQPAEPNGGGRFNAVKSKRLVPRPSVGTQIAGTKLMFFTQVLVDEAEYAPHSVFSTGCAGANETDIVVNIVANYKLPKKSTAEASHLLDGTTDGIIHHNSHRPDDKPLQQPEPEPEPEPEPKPGRTPSDPEQAKAVLVRSRLPPSTRLHVAAVTRHAENAPADFIGMAEADFGPIKRGRVELGSSTTGSASFAIEFEGGATSGEPIILAQPRYPSSDGIRHPEIMDAFGVELTDVHADGFAVNVARLDKLDNSGWGMMLRLDYIAMLPTPKPETDEDRVKLAALTYRAGNSKVGHTHKHKKVTGEARSVRVHIPFEPPLLPPTGSKTGMYGPPHVIATMCGETGQSFPDVHAIVVHGVDAHGFNATVLRVDDLGHGWMSNVRTHWLAWLPLLRLAPSPVSAPSEEVVKTRSDKAGINTPSEVRTAAQKVAAAPANGGDALSLDVPAAMISTVSAPENAAEHVHTRSILPSPSQSVHVFAEVANVSATVKTGSAVVHATGPRKSDRTTDFNHLPELADPITRQRQGAGDNSPGFVNTGETSSADGRKWDFVATKPVSAAEKDRDSGQRRGLSLDVDE